jgi:hypothetical protein
MKHMILSSLISIALITGCKKDNFEKPAARLSGRVVYNKEPLGLRSNGVQLEIWQRGYQLYSKVALHVAQDGSFSASLFDGNYKLVLIPGNGPWVSNTDTIDVAVNGSTTIDVNVQPYFIVKNATATKSGTDLNATVSLEQVDTRQQLEAVYLYVGSTNIVDQVNNLGGSNVIAANIPDLSQPVPLKLTIPASLASQPFFYARVGVKIIGVAEMIYSQPLKVQ